MGGGQGLEFGGGDSQQAHDVASTSFRRRVPTRFLINKCQIITFLILKYDIIENSRIELRGIVLLVQVGGLLGGGGPKGMLAPPLSNYWGGAGPLCPPPLPTPMITQYMQCSMLIVVLSISGSKMKIALTDVRSRVRESLAKRLI